MFHRLFACVVLGLALTACAQTDKPAPETAPEPAPEAAAPEAPETPEAPAPEEAEPAEEAPVADAPAATGDAGAMRTNQEGVALIKEHEGLRLEAYQGPSGKTLIGYGHSKTAKAGMTITEAQAEELLRQDLRDFEAGVAKAVTVPVNENEFSAMVSLAYTIGTGNFATSSVVKFLNQGDRAKAADSFLLWVKVNGVDSEHLIERRKKERALFVKPV